MSWASRRCAWTRGELVQQTRDREHRKRSMRGDCDNVTGHDRKAPQKIGLQSHLPRSMILVHCRRRARSYNMIRHSIHPCGGKGSGFATYYKQLLRFIQLWTTSVRPPAKRLTMICAQRWSKGDLKATGLFWRWTPTRTSLRATLPDGWRNIWLNWRKRCIWWQQVRDPRLETASGTR